MKQNLVKLLAVCTASVLLATISLAQNNQKLKAAAEKYVISAKAGGVNFVAGDVAVVRSKGKSGYLVKGDSLEAGEKVRTGNTGKAEILLNPGSFVRLAENTEFEFVRTSLDDLSVKVNAGSAIFEVFTVNELKVEINTPDSRFYIVRTGIYRVDMMNNATARLEVWKGRAQIGEDKSAIVKAGQAYDGGQTAKFNRKNRDEFEQWSKDRAKELDKVNARLRSREMDRALLSSFSQSSLNVRNSFGLWVFDPFSRNYCFLPFGYGWSSPYGFWYNNSIWNYRVPQGMQSGFTQTGNQPQYNQQPGQPSQTGQPGVSAPSQPINNPPSTSMPPSIDRGTPGIVQRKEGPIIN
jgi:hypothetical protein